MKNLSGAVVLVAFLLMNFNAVGQDFSKFLLHTGTDLHETGGNFDFALGDYNGDGKADLYAIKKTYTGTKTTEIHVLDGASKFSKFLLHTGSALHETRGNFDFLLGDYNGDGKADLYAIKKNQTGTKSTEVHVLDGASKFSKFLLHTGTDLHETGFNFDFALGDYNGDGKADLYAIKKSETGTKKTEIHVLDGASKFSKFLLHTGTDLHETGFNFDFVLGDYNRDGKADLYAIKKSNTGTKKTEVHVLDGASKFSKFLLHTGTDLHETRANFDFVLGDYNRDGKADLYAIKKSNTGTKKTEVHVLGAK